MDRIKVRIVEVEGEMGLGNLTLPDVEDGPGS